MSFAPGVLANDPDRRRIVLDVLRAGLAAADPGPAVERSLERRGGTLRVGGGEVDLDRVGRIRVLAFGKAAPAMARAAHAVLGDHQPTGLVVTHRPEPVPNGYRLVVAGHPVPDRGSIEAADRALSMARQAGLDDLVLCLVSGGGSALLERPVEGLRLEDLVRVTDLLLRSGTGIRDLNTVRKHLSSVKGGRLGAAVAPARLLTLVLSDVVGDPIDVIASGPTVPDPTTFAEALAILETRGIADRAPARIIDHLLAGTRGERPETPEDHSGMPEQEVVVIGNGSTAARGAADRAEQAGLSARVVTTELTGEARERAVECVERYGTHREVSIWAGETSVTVRGDGRGGRNQEAALAAALALDGDPTRIFATLGTDGIDGPTDAAGGLVDGRTLSRGRKAGLDARLHLERNDSHPYLRATGDHLVTGPTGTNVGDLWLAWKAE